MSASTPKKISGRDACVAVIRAAGKPMKALDIAKAVVSSGAVPTLKGKTPTATLSAQITSGAKTAKVFRRVGKSSPQVFDVRDDVPASDKALVEKMKKHLEAPAPTAAKPADAAPATEGDTPAEPAAGDLAKTKPDPKPRSTRKPDGSRAASKTKATA